MSEKNAALILLILAVLNWLVLLLFLNFVQPSPSAVIIFFLLLFSAILTTSAPINYYLIRRFPILKTREGHWPPLRRSVFIALYGFLCFWLRFLRAFDWLLALLVLGMMASLELFFSLFVD